MSARASIPRPFDPPPVSAGARYVLFHGDVFALMARSRTKRMGAAGIDAYWETNQTPSFLAPAEGMREWLCNVFVAQPHVICAMVLWKLGYRGVRGWQKMSSSQRSRIAGKALVDCMLLRGEEWDEAFLTSEGLGWLKAQLGLGEAGFERLLGQARREFNRLGRRDLRWGLWLTAGCFAVGGIWMLLAAFTWQVLVLFAFGVVFAVHTLAYTLPRVRGYGVAGLGRDRPSLDTVRARAKAPGNQVTEPEAFPQDRGDLPQDLRQSEREMEDGSQLRDQQYLSLARSMDRAKDLLNRGEAESALNALESFAAVDYRGIHTGYPEFYEIRRACEQSLGRDSRNADSRIEEMRLDWITALRKGETLLKAGKAKESIAYFERSLRANPGEYGTSSGMDAANLGIKSAKALLKRQKKS